MQKKMLVKIVGSEQITTTKKVKVIGNKLIIDAGKAGAGNKALKPTYNNNCILRDKNNFPILGRFLKLREYVIYPLGALSCIEFYEGIAINPKYSFDTIEWLFSQNVFEKAGNIHSKKHTPAILYVIALGVIILVANLLFGVKL